MSTADATSAAAPRHFEAFLLDENMHPHARLALGGGNMSGNGNNNGNASSNGNGNANGNGNGNSGRAAPPPPPPPMTTAMRYAGVSASNANVHGNGNTNDTKIHVTSRTFPMAATTNSHVNTNVNVNANANATANVNVTMNMRRMASAPPAALAARVRVLPPTHSGPTSSNSAGSGLTVASGGVARRVAPDDIPVLESSGSYSFFSDGEDDDDDDDDDDGVDDDPDDIDGDVDTSSNRSLSTAARRALTEGEDEDGDEEEVSAFDETRDLVPVLQTTEDARVHEFRAHVPMPVPNPAGTRLPRLSSWRTPSRNMPRPLPDARSVAITAEDTMAMGLESHGSFATTVSSSASISMTPGAQKPKRDVIRSGWLVRKGQHLKTWKRRYFVILKCTNVTTGDYSASLQYYKSSNFQRKRGEIDLNDGPLTIRFVDMNERRRPYCFEIVHREFSLICQGRNDEDVTAWVCHLQYLSGHEVSISAAGAASAATIPRVGFSGTMDTRTIFALSELRRLLCRSASSAAAKCLNFAKTFECRSTASLQKLRDLHASLTTSLIQSHGKRILMAIQDRTRPNVHLDPFTIEDLTVLVSRHVEEVLFARVQDVILDYLHDAFGDDDSTISRKLRWLQGKDQTYFNIPMDQLSRKGWIHAAKCLGQLNAALLPTTKFEILVATVQEIRATYAEEHNQPMDTNTLETDDLVPIFTYVLANSGADNLASTRVMLSEINCACTIGRLAEANVAFQIFGYAVDFINDVTIPSALEDLFKDQVTLSLDSDWRNVLDLEPEPTYRCGAMVRQISQQASNAIGSTLARKHVLVTVNGQNVALWPYKDVVDMLNQSNPPHRLSFIPCNSYYTILTTGKALWNVALANACQRGDIASVQMLLANGADVNYVAQESGGNMPLHIAVSALHFNVVSFVLQHGAKVKAVGECGRNALHMLGAACTLPSAAISDTAFMELHGSLDKMQTEERVTMIAKKLINHGAQLESTDIYGNTPLLLLAAKGYAGAVDALLEADGNINVDARNWHEGMCALALAAKGGHLEVVKLLLDNGADPNLASLRGDTPLHFAASIANKEICQALVSRGCDVNERNLDGVTPLMVAATRGFMCGVSLQDAMKRQLEMQSQPDDLKVFLILDHLLTAGADPHAVCRSYRSPLHYAALFGDAEVLQYLSIRIDPQHSGSMALNQRDLFGKTSLQMAEARIAEIATLAGVEVPAGDEEEDKDLQLLRNSSKQRRDSGSDLIIDEDENGNRVIVAGSLDALLRAVFDSGSYQVDDAIAMAWICDPTVSRTIVEFLHTNLKDHVGTKEGLQVRRMVLHALDAMVQSFMQRVEMDSRLCEALFRLCHVLFPFREEKDLQCAHWLSKSHLPAFADAVRAKKLHELRMIAYCEDAYADVRSFLQTAKDAHRSLKFLDDDLFASSFGMEVISDSLRRRLTIAGVWTSDTSAGGAREGSDDAPAETASSPIKARALTPPAHPRTKPKKQPRLSVLDIDVNVLAQQMTVLQHYMFSRIKLSELLVSKKSAERTPAYDRVRQLHNHISLWVVNEILQRNDADERAQILAHFIKVAGVCFSPLQNFDGFMAIMNATNDSSIYRLKRTWGRLPPHVWDQWHDLKAYTESGARPMNKIMRDCQPPCNPYLGVIMQNVIAIQEFPDNLEGDLINFKKIRVLGNLVQRLLLMQKSPYLLPTHKAVLDNMCRDLLYSDPEDRYRQSLLVEPRMSTTVPSGAPPSAPPNQWALYQRL